MTILRILLRQTIPHSIIISIGLFFITGCDKRDKNFTNKNIIIQTILANSKQINLRVSYFGNGNIHVISNNNAIYCQSHRICSGQFEKGETITLQAIAAPNWTFDGWQYCDKIEKNHCTVTMNAAKLISTTFSTTY